MTFCHLFPNFWFCPIYKKKRPLHCYIILWEKGIGAKHYSMVKLI